jgi:hypothetical protein
VTPACGDAHDAHLPRPVASAAVARVALHVATVLLVATVSSMPAVGRADARFENHAKGSTTYAVPRYVVASGGGTSSGGEFALQGSIGQLNADPLAPLSGGAFAVSGGFWPGIAPPAPSDDTLFASGFEPTAP